MSAGHAVCAVLATALGFGVALWLVFRTGNWPYFPSAPVAALASLALTLGGWWLGYLVFRPARKPGQRCVKCGFDLRACKEPRCSECGAPFDPSKVRIRLS
jgi:hypothetical protein